MAPSRLWVGLFGCFAALAPRAMLALHAKVNLFGFQNTEPVEPAEWLVSLTRIAGLLALGWALFGSESDGSEDIDRDGIDFV